MTTITEMDRKILRALMEDGRQPNTQLAETVGLSPSQCWQRVRRLEEAGIIAGYHARLNQELMGVPEIVLVEITLERNEGYQLEQIGQTLAELPEVLEMHVTSGEFDLFIKIAVSGTRGYEEFLKNKLYRISGIRHSRSIFSLRCFKNEMSYVPHG
ncbi:Lrp/AsnC family transcriptional regulator [Aliisedimentitalea scapharcae]|uniref:Lrp/AsnC family transcriptional regulator n=1 Tax=Aliisedimentitalea scapharcae TaxID=1524259 RepID=A0ABZ2XTK6_9RHOB|nr:Lrp/AsnC family transcriptional regulator [Rhodobacteraceae bacterium M382]